jgi:hypothetical protein
LVVIHWTVPDPGLTIEAIEGKVPSKQRKITEEKDTELRIMVPSLEIARAHVRVLELEADRLRVRAQNPATLKRLRSALRGRSH